MSDRQRDDRRRDDKQRERQVFYFATLKAIAETLNKGGRLPETLASALPMIVGLLGLHTGWVFLLSEQDTFFVAGHHNLPPALTYPSSAWDGSCECQRLMCAGSLCAVAQIVECSRLRSASGDRQGLAYHASVPLFKGDHLIGIMNVATAQWDLFTPPDLQILSAVGYQLATAIERLQLSEQTTHMALIEERNRLARDVHDTLAQELTGIALQLETADALFDVAPERARARLRQALTQVRTCLADARRSVVELRGGPLERQELPLALAGLARRFGEETGIAVVTSIALDEPRLPPRSEEGLYRIAQEALANIRQHARAREVRLELRRHETHISLTIADDGCGFVVHPTGNDTGRQPMPPETPATPAPHPSHGFGLIGMQERAHLLAGHMHISSCPGSGTIIDITIPSQPPTSVPDLLQ